MFSAANSFPVSLDLNDLSFRSSCKIVVQLSDEPLCLQSPGGHAAYSLAWSVVVVDFSGSEPIYCWSKCSKQHLIYAGGKGGKRQWWPIYHSKKSCWFKKKKTFLSFSINCEISEFSSPSSQGSN